MLTISTRCLQDFGKLAQSEAQRDLELLSAIEWTVDHLSYTKNNFDQLTALANKLTEAVASATEPVDPHSLLVADYEKIRDAYGQAYERLRTKRNVAAYSPTLRGEADL